LIKLLVVVAVARESEISGVLFPVTGFGYFKFLFLC